MIQSSLPSILHYERGEGEGKQISRSLNEKRLKLKNHKNKFTFDLHNEHPELLVFTHFVIFLLFLLLRLLSIFTTLINQKKSPCHTILRESAIYVSSIFALCKSRLRAAAQLHHLL